MDDRHYFAYLYRFRFTSKYEKIIKTLKNLKVWKLKINIIKEYLRQSKKSQLLEVFR